MMVAEILQSETLCIQWAEHTNREDECYTMRTLCYRRCHMPADTWDC